jgi:hypothetical protein
MAQTKPNKLGDWQRCVVRMRPEVYQALKVAAADGGLLLSEMVNDAITTWLRGQGYGRVLQQLKRRQRGTQR